MKLNKAIKSFHGFGRPDSHLVYGTYHGAIVTILGCSLALILLISELHQYLYSAPVHEISVDPERHALLRLGLDITFPALPCSLMSVDMADAAGDIESDAMYSVQHMHVHKQRLTAGGQPVKKGDYHAPKPDTIMIVAGAIVQDSQQHMTDMEQELKDREGCQVYGYLDVKRLAGTLKLTVHMKDWLLLASVRAELNQAYHDMEDRLARGDASQMDVHSNFAKANVSHHITRLTLGDDYPGRVNPLDGFTRIVDHDFGTYNYYLKIVPTTHVSPLWRRTLTHQYSVSEFFVPGILPGGAEGPARDVMPAITFAYDLSPLAVKIWYPKRAVGSFLVRLCAVLGGCFALTGFVDGIVHFLARSGSS